MNKAQSIVLGLGLLMPFYDAQATRGASCGRGKLVELEQQQNRLRDVQCKVTAELRKVKNNLAKLAVFTEHIAIAVYNQQEIHENDHIKINKLLQMYPTEWLYVNYFYRVQRDCMVYRAWAQNNFVSGPLREALLDTLNDLQRYAAGMQQDAWYYYGCMQSIIGI